MSDVRARARRVGRAVGDEPESRTRLLLAGIDLFSSVGYHATTTRDLSQAAGMSPAALYVHYRSKADLLAEIAVSGHRQVVEELEAALAAAGDDPVDRFRSLARAFVSWHAAHIAVARIGVLHLHDVPKERFDEVRRLRQRIEELFETELRAGQKAGLIEAENVHHIAIVVISLGLDLARWYSPQGEMAPARIGALYADLAVRMVRPR